MKKRISRDLVERFCEKYISEPYSGCWIWTGAAGMGYGRMKFNGRLDAAHRVAYCLFVGEIGNLHVLHKCDTPLCVNPSHLFLGTHSDNLRDASIKHRFPCRIGSKSCRSKLTSNQVASIRSQYSAGRITEDSLAKQFSVSQVTISKAIHRKTYYEVIE